MRLRAGMTQAELAEAIGVSAPAVSLYESEKRCMPVSTFVALAQALGCSLDDLVGEEAEDETED